MSLDTTLFMQYPWIGGINTSLDPATIASNELVQADNLLFGVRGSRKKRDSINFDWDDASNGSASVLALHDFWYGTSSKSQKLLAIFNDRTAYSYNTSGTRTTITVGGTAWSGTLTSASFETLGNLAIVAVSGSGNVMKKYTGSGNWTDLGVNTTTGDTHTNTTIDNIASMTGFVVGATITGSGIPANTVITEVRTSSITISQATSSTLTGTALTVTVTAPAASICRKHLGRLWTNDKTNLDRLHYSSVANAEEWGGLGDSGAFPIGTGDGDPDGITAIFPSFKGVLFVAKRTKLYRLLGTHPENIKVELVTSGLGCVSHNSIATIDQDDIFYISQRGVHSLVATDKYGDFEGAYLSSNIQKTFNEDWSRSRLKFSHGAYLSNINSVAFAVTDTSLAGTTNNALWLYNIPLKSWYRWKDVSCEALTVVEDSDQQRFYLGTATSRVAKTFTGANADTSTSGSSSAILMTIKTGIVIPDDNIYMIKGFKKFALIYKPEGTHTITVSLKVDNKEVQPLSFAESNSTALLGSTFILGTSTLGYNVVLAPYTQPIGGFGRGIQITIETSGVEDPVEIQGFAIEYEPAETSQEVQLAA